MKRLGVLLLFLLGFMTLSACAQAQQEAQPHDPLHADLDRLRREAGLSPLTWNEELARAAHDRAREQAERGELDADTRTDRLLEDFRRAGYDIRSLEEASVILKGGSGFSRGLIDQWQRLEPDSLARFLSPEVAEIGVGTARRGDVTVYTLLAAATLRDLEQESAAMMVEREELRREMLAVVNRERRRARRAPLARDAALDRAAQQRADDMARRQYYGHTAPDGITFVEVLEDADYDAYSMAENIALGQDTVGEAMTGWMDSRGHRQNLLEADFTKVGFGVAIGIFDDGPSKVWVQLFARPARSSGGSQRAD
jgi:uncharacterized protein YkwD